MPLSRRSFLASSTSLTAPTFANAAPTRPNILLFLCNDLNTDLSCYGTASALTQAVDKLPARGLCFDRAYCQGPLCNPSRSSFLSGRRPETTRVFDQQTVLRQKDPCLTFLPDHFRQQAYFVAASGKIFHHAKPFLLLAGLRKPHLPWGIPKNYFAPPQRLAAGSPHDWYP